MPLAVLQLPLLIPLLLLFPLPLLLLLLLLRLRCLVIVVQDSRVRRAKEDRRSVALPATNTWRPALRSTKTNTAATTEIQALPQTPIVPGQACKAWQFDVMKSRSYVVRFLSWPCRQKGRNNTLGSYIKRNMFVLRGRGRRDC